MLRTEGRDGYILPLVLVIFLCLGILAINLFHLPGRMRRATLRLNREMQCIYDAESGVVAHLAGFPKGYFHNIAAADELALGPYRQICVPLGEGCRLGGNSLCALGVEPFREISVGDWMRATERYRRELLNLLESRAVLKSASGNRRFFKLPAVHFLHLRDGDLLLDAGGQVQSAGYLVDGNVTVKGSAIFDTLRIYSRGNVSIGGEVAVGHLEVSGTEITLDGGARVRGLLLASRRVECSGRALARYPSFAVALGQGTPEIQVKDRAILEGSAVAPGGSVLLGASKNLDGACVPCGEAGLAISDSVKAALPSFFGGNMIVFSSGVLP